jgi:hypothetical protein
LITKNGTLPKTDNKKFGHVYKHNGKIMMSPKTQINFYHLSMTKIDTNQCNTLLPKSIWHYIVGKSIKNGVRLSIGLEEGLFFPRIHLLTTQTTSNMGVMTCKNLDA